MIIILNQVGFSVNKTTAATEERALLTSQAHTLFHSFQAPGEVGRKGLDMLVDANMRLERDSVTKPTVMI